MKFFLRTALLLASAVCIVLLAGTLVLWYRGRFVAGESLLFRHASDGPPWRRVMVQGWSSAGGLRLVVNTARTTDPPAPPLPGLDPGPGWTPFGRRGWDADYTTYSTRPYPWEDFMARSWSWRGFQIAHESSGMPTFWERQRSVTVPAWFAALVLAVPPMTMAASIFGRRRAARRRERLGLCPRCAYDMRATPERCPECGHVPRSIESAA